MTCDSGQPARIMYVDHASETGGAEKSLLDIIQRLDRSHFEPILACSQEADWLDAAQVGEIAIERVFTPGGVLARRRDELADRLLASKWDVVRAAGPVWRLVRLFRRYRPAIVHTNTLKTHALAGAAAWLTRRRLIWHLRDILEPGNALDWLQRMAHRFRPKVIAISEAVKRSLGGVDIDVVVIHNGTDLSAFHPRPDREALRRSLGLEPDHVAVSIVGRLTPWKGHRELLRAFCSVIHQQPEARLLVVGEVAFWKDEYGLELKEMAEKLGISSVVNWLGFREDVPEILAASDVFALPSVGEPFGRAIVEAMASEKPVVATRSGGVPEIVVDGETGLLVMPGDDKALASALVKLIRDARLRQAMGRAGRERALRLFDVNQTVARVQKVYHEMLGSNGRRVMG